MTEPDATELGADIAVTRDGLLTVALDDGKTLEVALTREGALSLAKQMIAFACPEETLRAAVVAGRA